MCMPLVSIIVPVYGVERYLENCIKSILSQTYSGFEIILVDDCSPDRCPEICDEEALKDNRIRVIHKPVNEGLGFARNTGLESARGEYVIFLDSDDYIESTLLEKAVGALEDSTDMVIFGINRVFEDKNGDIIKTEKLIPEEISAASPKETADIFRMLNEKKAFPFAWNKLYRRSFIEKHSARFESTKLIEDFLFNIYLFGKAPHIKTISDCLYFYRKPAHETLANTYTPEFFNLCKRKYTLEKEFLNAMGEFNNENRQLICFLYIKHLISVFLRNRSEKAGLSGKEQRVKIKEALGDEMTKEVFSAFTPSGIMIKAVMLILKSGSPVLCQMFILAAERLKPFGN